jgi:hypothetical protein
MSFAWETVAASGKGPGSRSRHCIAYDAGARAVVLFSGVLWVGNGRLLPDTWELREGAWTRTNGWTRPLARHRGAMVYDRERGCCILFGGQADAVPFLGDTWTYQDQRWRKRSHWWHRPRPRCGHALAFDESLGKTVLFGGVGSHQKSLGDTWLFDGGSWRRVSAPGPPARRYAALAYDPVLKGCLLHGGSIDDAGRRGFGDAWLFRDESWERLPECWETDVRDDHGLAFHHAAGRMIMLDGNTGARGVLASSSRGWQAVDVNPLHPRHQCSPLVWHDDLGGLLLHGGEAYHAGPQLDASLLLRLTD